MTVKEMREKRVAEVESILEYTEQEVVRLIKIAEKNMREDGEPYSSCCFGFPIEATHKQIKKTLHQLKKKYKTVSLGWYYYGFKRNYNIQMWLKEDHILSETN